jgi:hypothetical protein
MKSTDALIAVIPVLCKRSGEHRRRGAEDWRPRRRDIRQYALTAG